MHRVTAEMSAPMTKGLPNDTSKKCHRNSISISKFESMAVLTPLRLVIDLYYLYY